MSEKIARLFSNFITKETTVRSWLVDTPCWIYEGWQDKDGYGRYTIELPRAHNGDRRRKHIYAHRLAWKLAGKSIPRGMVLDHLCMVRNCVRPSHLEAVTQIENTRRRDEYLKNARITPWKKGG
jgi:hypothetical protein